MNKVIAKVGQASLMGLFGYEIGQNQVQEPVVVKVEKSDIENSHLDGNRDLIIVLLVALLAFIILMILMMFRYRGKKPRVSSSLRV